MTWFGISWWRVVAGGVAAVALLIAIGWAVSPWFAQRANQKAAAHVTAVVAAAKPQEAAAAAKVEGKSDAKVENLTVRSRARVARIVGGPDSDGEFYAGMCERELYKADPECGGGGGKRGAR